MNEETILIQAGLSEEQALTYQSLLEKGPQRASSLSTWTGIKRSLTYKVLQELEHAGLVEKKESDGTVAMFFPLHPSSLLETIERKKLELDRTKEVLSTSLGALVSKYNLVQGKPNIRFFEGAAGARSVTAELPTVDTEILQYLDSESMINHFPAENEQHLKKRTSAGIKKRTLIPERPFTIDRAQHYDPAVTTARILVGATAFPTAIQIYDDKVSFLTLTDAKTVGIIIEDKEINQMMRIVFESQWKSATPIVPASKDTD